MVPDQRGHRVEAFVFQHVLDFALPALDQDFTDPTVNRFLLPATRQDVVAHGGQGVPDEEVTATGDQRF